MSYPIRTLAALLVAVMSFLPWPVSAEALPPSFLALLPEGANHDARESNWSVMDTSVTGGLRARFPGTPRNCFRLESELNLRLDGNPEFESIPDILDPIEQENIEQARSGLAEEARARGRKGGVGSLDVVSVGPVAEEKLPTGIVFYYEYIENCANRDNARVASLRGHARKGATLMSFSLLMNTGLDEARVKARQILDRFAAFDLEAAARGK